MRAKTKSDRMLRFLRNSPDYFDAAYVLQLAVECDRLDGPYPAIFADSALGAMQPIASKMSPLIVSAREYINSRLTGGRPSQQGQAIISAARRDMRSLGQQYIPAFVAVIKAIEAVDGSGYDAAEAIARSATLFIERASKPPVTEERLYKIHDSIRTKLEMAGGYYEQVFRPSAGLRASGAIGGISTGAAVLVGAVVGAGAMHFAKSR